jgi:hypothetical protein
MDSRDGRTGIAWRIMACARIVANRSTIPRPIFGQGIPENQKAGDPL